MNQLDTAAVAPVAAMKAIDFATSDPALAGTPGTSPGDMGVHVHLADVVGLITLRADPATEGLAATAQSTLGTVLPTTLCHVDTGPVRVRWLSPDEFLVSCPLDAVAEAIAALRSGTTGRLAATDVSGGYAVFEISGQAAVEVLAKSTSYDVHTRRFPIGRTVSTVFAKTTAVISRVGESRYEIICRRSFAAYVARWISEAAREHGLMVDTSAT